MLWAGLDRTKDFWRSEMRVLVALPILFLLIALAMSTLGIELTLRVMSALPPSPAQGVALGKVRLGLIGIGSLAALGLGLLLAITIAQPVRRLVRRTRARLQAFNPAPAGAAPVNELADFSDAVNHALLAFDKFVTDSQILEGMPEGVLLVDGQDRIKRINAEARRFLQASGNLEGSALAQLSPPEIAQALTNAIKRARETRAVVQLSPVPVIGTNGAESEWSVMLTVSLAGESGEMLATVKDLSQIPSIRTEIRRVDQLAAVGVHVASLAHEVSGCLMAIQTLLDLLPAQADDGVHIKTKLQAEVERAGRLLEEIRAFGQASLRERTPCQPGDLVEETLWVVQTRFLGKAIEVVKQIGPDLPAVLGDRDRLTQAFMNILTNAFEATPPGGTIKVIAEREGAEVIIRVANTGFYILPEDQKKIFTLFYTTKRHGTGLGLSLALRAVKDHGGHIEVTSSKEAGTEFAIRLPA
jgi:signal transduction histidine kinase